MEHTECSETSAYKLQTPGKYPKESIQHGNVCFIWAQATNTALAEIRLLHLRTFTTATSNSVLLWHRQAPRCCISGPNKVTGWSTTSHRNDYNIYCIWHKLCTAVHVHALRLFLMIDQLFEPLKQNVWGQIPQHEEVEMADHEWLWMQEPDFDHNGIFKLMVQQDKCIKILRDCVRKH